jgi:endonuclease YncB( thermonuclease family)
MSRVNFRLIINLVLLWSRFSSTCCATELSEWKVSDKLTLAAEVISLVDGQVYLEDVTGAVSVVPLERLPAENQRRVLDSVGWGRLWSDTSGKHSLAARLVEVQAGRVTLEDSRGLIRHVPLERLCESDRDYLSQQQFGCECRDLSSCQAFQLNCPIEFTTKAIKVVDGDTFAVQYNDREILIQLHGVAAPRADQEFSDQARDYLAKLVEDKSLFCTRIGYVAGAKVICRVMADGQRTDLSTRMLQSGLAWYDERQTDEPSLRSAQLDAKILKIKIWSRPSRVAPWVWSRMDLAAQESFRQDLNEKTNQLAAAKAQQAQLKSKAKPTASRTPKRNSQFAYNYRVVYQLPRTWPTYWLNTNSGVRHNPSCHWFGNTNAGAYRGPNAGRGCKVCGGSP